MHDQLSLLIRRPERRCDMALLTSVVARYLVTGPCRFLRPLFFNRWWSARLQHSWDPRLPGAGWLPVPAGGGLGLLRPLADPWTGAQAPLWLLHVFIPESRQAVCKSRPPRALSAREEEHAPFPKHCPHNLEAGFFFILHASKWKELNLMPPPQSGSKSKYVFYCIFFFAAKQAFFVSSPWWKDSLLLLLCLSVFVVSWLIYTSVFKRKLSWVSDF